MKTQETGAIRGRFWGLFRSFFCDFLDYIITLLAAIAEDDNPLSINDVAKHANWLSINDLVEHDNQLSITDLKDTTT